MNQSQACAPCPDCKGTGRYQPLFGPAEPCQTCRPQEVSVEPLPMSGDALSLQESSAYMDSLFRRIAEQSLKTTRALTKSLDESRRERESLGLPEFDYVNGHNVGESNWPLLVPVFIGIDLGEAIGGFRKRFDLPFTPKSGMVLEDAVIFLTLSDQAPVYNALKGVWSAFADVVHPYNAGPTIQRLLDRLRATGWQRLRPGECLV